MPYSTVPPAVLAKSLFAIVLGVSCLVPGRPSDAWTRRTTAGISLTSVASDRDGNVFVAGTRLSPAWEGSLYLASYSPSGSLRWEVVEPGGTGDAAANAAALALDRKGDVYVTGSAPVDGGNARFVVLKYSGASGARRWRTRLTADTEPAAPLGSGNAVAVDRYGRVAVGGFEYGDGYLAGIIARLDAATGRPDWQWTARDTQVQDVALASNGDVLGTGSFLAVRLGASGQPLWRVDQSGSRLGSHGAPRMRSIALDSSGNVIVGGQLRTLEIDTRTFYVARLNGATGTVRWEYAGPRLETLETPARVRTDTDGNVYAAGRLRQEPGSIRLRARDGSRRWLHRPWEEREHTYEALPVTDLVMDGTSLYVCGWDTREQTMVAGYTRAGHLKWRRSLGEGRGVAVSRSPEGRLFVVATTQAPDGRTRSTIAGLRTSSGRGLPGE
jgi:hypothetical protein